MLTWIGNTQNIPNVKELYQNSHQESLILIGRPKATEIYTIEQLEEMGLIGVYAEELEDENETDL